MRRHRRPRQRDQRPNGPMSLAVLKSHGQPHAWTQGVGLRACWPVRTCIAGPRAFPQRGWSRPPVDLPHTLGGLRGSPEGYSAWKTSKDLSNLFDNAVSYSPSDSPVSVSRWVANGFVEIAITDRGLGIAPKHQKRVFERLFRVDQARSRSTGGTWLTLAIVQRWREPGTSSTFTLRIPAHPDSLQHAARTPSTPEYVAGSL